MRIQQLFLALLSMVVLITGCAVQQSSEPTDEEITEIRQALLEGFNPLAGDFETVVSLSPEMGDSPENLVVLEKGGKTLVCISSLLNGQIICAEPYAPPEEYLRIPVPEAVPGSFMSGLEVTDNGDIVFAIAFFGQYGPTHSGVYKLDTDTNAITALATIPLAGLNGVSFYNGHWYAVDALNPAGVIYRGSLENNDSAIWYTGIAVQPDLGYIPSTCNPPFALGGNGLRIRVRPAYTYLGIAHPDAFMVSNTTRKNISLIDIEPDGTAGAVTERFTDLPYPDDIWPSTYCNDTFLATHGLQAAYYINAAGNVLEIADGLVCDGPTALYAYNEMLYMSCGGDPLICGPDENGDPCPPATSCTPITRKPAVVAAPVKWWYDAICRLSKAA